jgi:hypothetical protein
MRVVGAGFQPEIDAVRVWPTIGKPVMLGAGLEEKSSPEVTLAVGVEDMVVVVEPGLDPVTRTVMALPKSFEVSK